MKWLYAVERLALRAVAPRRAARRLRPTEAGSDSGRPLCAGGLVAARPLPPPNGHAIAVSGCALEHLHSAVNPNGIPSYSPGLARRRLPWVEARASPANPERVASMPSGRGGADWCNPFRVERPCGMRSQGSPLARATLG